MGNWRVCPTCVEISLARVCSQGHPTVAAGGPSESPVFLVHLSLLLEAPPPFRLLEGDLDSLLWFPATSSEKEENRFACWRHQGRPVCVWRAEVKTLDIQNGPSGSFGKGIWGVAGLLLLEMAGDRHFEARYARQNRGASPPSLDLFLDRVLAALRQSGARLRGIAVVAGRGCFDARNEAQLRAQPWPVQVFENRNQALVWLLGLLTERSVPLPETPVRPGRVEVFDVGGMVGTKLLSWLHSLTVEAHERGRHRINSVGGRFGYRLYPRPTETVLEWGRIHQIRRGVAPRDVVPPWSGGVCRWMGTLRPLHLSVFGSSAEGDGATADSVAVLVGIGARSQGARDLIRLLELSWSGKLTPVAFIQGERADARFLRWARQNFPGLRIFADSVSGRDQALQIAFDRVLRRETVADGA